jgi:hypothetical protein
MVKLKKISNFMTQVCFNYFLKKYGIGHKRDQEKNDDKWANQKKKETIKNTRLKKPYRRQIKKTKPNH